MNLILKRSRIDDSGAYGALMDESDGHVCFTLSHTYQGLGGLWRPKVLPGVYVCVRGTHQLEGHTEPFETFEITGVVGHNNILFHCGNVENDSSGCELLGLEVDGNSILKSLLAFNSFMALQEGVDKFQLTVE